MARAKPVRKRVLINGVVQGVGFRPFIYRTAIHNALIGSVKNLGDAGVEVIIEGSEQGIAQFLWALESKKPPLAELEELKIEDLPRDGRLTEFKIERSDAGGRGSGTIPPDVAICNECLEDIRGRTRYKGYWATSCTNCGPRLTTIRSLPYDRPRTSFAQFPMCENCRDEYTEPLDRRYHAQTIACPQCGPRLYFNDSTQGDPIRLAVQALKQGRVVAIKGLGGTHLACDATREETVLELRRRLGRSYQPLALMATEEQLPKMAEVSPEEWEMLRSPRRPIIVLDKKDGAIIAPAIAPGLHNVGVMLPYSGLHYLLFEHLRFPLVMTSANLPGRPMLIGNDEIKDLLWGIADGFLLHDREIVARCDDSVLRRSGGEWRPIRRSRGWVPTAMEIDLGKRPLLALGAELNDTFALYRDGRCYLSQHIGNVDELETFEFLRQAVEHMLSIIGMELPPFIACDLHPRFLTTRLAEELGERMFRIQHHHAHVGAVLGEFALEKVVGIAVDGVGYGTDGKIWGGEVLVADRAGFERYGGLRMVPMAGGDLATRFPARMAAGFLCAAGESGAELVRLLKKYFPLRRSEEAELIVRQLQTELNVFYTSSAGRFLDAVSVMLGICAERSYEGEPAMRLEAEAVGGEVIELELPFFIEDSRKVLDTAGIFRNLLDLRQDHNKEDIAATAQWALAGGLAQIAVEAARTGGIKDVALSGGVAYNDAITNTIRHEVERAGLKLYVNQRVPCGDGGVSFGQAVIAGACLGLEG